MSPHLPSEISVVLNRLRGRIRQYVLWEGLALVIALLGGVFWGSFLIDWGYFQLSKLELPREFRAFCLIGTIAALAAALLVWVIFRLVRALRVKALALVLERRFPQLDNRLITAVEAVDDRDVSNHPLSVAMLSQTIRDAARLAEQLDLSTVFDWGPLRRAVIMATVTVASILGLFVFHTTAMDRWLHAFIGLDETYWNRQTQLKVRVLLQPGDRIREFEQHHYRHPKGADLTLLIEAMDGTVWPERVQLSYRLKNGRGSGQPFLQRSGDQPFLYTMAGLLDDVEIWVTGNDYRNAVPYRVEVVEPPHVDAVRLEALYPTYTGWNVMGPQGPERTILPVQGVQISVPMETEFLLAIQANKPLRAFRLEGESQGERFEWEFGRNMEDKSSSPSQAGFLTLKSADGKPQQRIPWPDDLLKQLWSSDQRTFTLPFVIPVKGVERLSSQLAQAAESGKLTLPMVLPPDTLLRIHLEDAHGISSTEPGRLTINGIVDEPPRLETELKGIGTSITRKARIPIAGVITDDYGVAAARFDFKVDGEPDWQPRDFSQAATRQKEYQLARSEDEPFERFDVLPLDLSMRQKLLVTVWANDADDKNGPHETRGQKYEFTIVPVEELLSILFAKELNLRKRFEQLLSEVQGTKQDLEVHREKIALVAKWSGQPEAEQRTEDIATTQQAISACAERSLHAIRKNATETESIAAAFRDIREELVNNGADTPQMLDRLDLKIIAPLQRINENDYPTIDGTLGLFRLANEQGTDPASAVANAIEEIDVLIERLEQVLHEMQELEHFHKILENLKQMITDQQDLIDKTKKKRKENAIKALE